MLIKTRKSWEIPESEATPEHVYMNRREWLKAAGFTGMAAGAASLGIPAPAIAGVAPDLYPAPRNYAYKLDRDITAEEAATTYTNFYEFGSSKNIWKKAQRLNVDDWSVTIDGMVAQKKKVAFEDLVRQMSLEERLYRHRCVEAWAMAVPWTGFTLAELVKWAEPTAAAKYVRFETFENKRVAPGQKEFWYPWPYVEGITIEEAMNDMTFIATGLYGKPLPKQNGAPLRLVLPWKYGFKSIKSLVRITFTDERPVSFWEEVNDKEYGFWANVNPEVPHPRWSQASEKILGTAKRRKTMLYNGYEAEVAHLYKDTKQDDYLFR